MISTANFTLRIRRNSVFKIQLGLDYKDKKDQVNTSKILCSRRHATITRNTFEKQHNYPKILKVSSQHILEIRDMYYFASINGNEYG